MKSGYNCMSFNSIFERVNNKPFIVEISSRNGMKLVLIVPILSLCRKIVSRGSIYSISRVFDDYTTNLNRFVSICFLFLDDESCVTLFLCFCI